MGITANGLKWQDDLIKKYVKGRVVMAELGDQCFVEDIPSLRVSNQEPVKRYYERAGVKHTSFDISGRNGSLVIDLCQPVPPHFNGVFNVVTNHGTTEHVTNQYAVFKNIHDLCRVGGIMLHAVPVVGSWPNHGRYYYELSFFEMLAKKCRYKVLELSMNKWFGIGNEEIQVCYCKTDSPFADVSGFSKGVFDSGDTRCTGDYL